MTKSIADQVNAVVKKATKHKPTGGRPRKGEGRPKPWIVMGCSERTYWRRMKEARESGRQVLDADNDDVLAQRLLAEAKDKQVPICTVFRGYPLVAYPWMLSTGPSRLYAVFKAAIDDLNPRKRK